MPCGKHDPALHIKKCEVLSNRGIHSKYQEWQELKAGAQEDSKRYKSRIERNAGK